MGTCACSYKILYEQVSIHVIILSSFMVFVMGWIVTPPPQFISTWNLEDEIILFILNPITGTLGRKGENTHRHWEEGHVKTKLKRELCCHKSSNVRSHQKLEETVKYSPLKLSEGTWLRQALILDFWPPEV